MESENGVVVLEDEKQVIVEKSNHQLEEAGGSTGLTHKLIFSDNLPKIKTSSSSSSSNPNGGPKTSKLSKNLSTSTLLVAFGRSTKSNLTQSLSFPARGRQFSDIMKRSIEVYPSKADIRQSQKNSSRIESQISNGSLVSSPRIRPASKVPFPRVSSKAGKAIRPPTLRQSAVKKTFRFRLLELITCFLFLLILTMFWFCCYLFVLQYSLGKVRLLMEPHLITMCMLA